MHARLIRWIPAVVAPVVVAGAIALPLTAAAASPNLPTKTAGQVLQLVAGAKSIKGFSGTVEQTSALGLPTLPTTGAGTDSSTASALELVTGDHKARVEVAGTTRSRVAVLDATSERDVVVDGRSVWLWDYKTKAATHVVATGTAKRPTTGTVRTPAEIADRLLADIGPSTAVTVDRTTEVAGHDAYTLVLTPRTTATTVGSIRIAVDAATGLPLEVAAYAKGSASPAFETAFTDLTYAVPAASTFVFTPPTGAKVTTKTVTAPKAGARRHTERLSTAQRPTVTGTGWSSVVEIPAADVPADLASNPTFTRLSTATAGGRVVSTALVNVLLTSDGRAFAGAVPVSSLQAAASAG